MGRDVPPQGWNRTMGIKFVGACRFSIRFCRRENSVVMEIVWRDNRALRRPFILIAPMSSDEDAAFRCLVGVAAAHDENSHGRLMIDAIFDSFQPMIEPA